MTMIIIGEFRSHLVVLLVVHFLPSKVLRTTNGYNITTFFPKDTTKFWLLVVSLLVAWWYLWLSYYFRFGCLNFRSDRMTF